MKNHAHPFDFSLEQLAEIKECFAGSQDTLSKASIRRGKGGKGLEMDFLISKKD